MAETPEPLSPLWYLEKLYAKLLNRQASNDYYQNYYDGNHPFEVATIRYKNDFIAMLNKVCDNWMPLVVDAVEERLTVQGFRYGEEPKSDKDAWAIFQRNHLDEDSTILHNTALTLGTCYELVWGDKDDQPIITVEHPNEMVTATQPGNRRNILAALKVWRDDWLGDGAVFADLYLTDYVYHYHFGLKSSEWEEFKDPTKNPLGEIPVVQFTNRSNLYGTGKSEFLDVITTQDQINKLVKDMIVASEFAAFPQRWATGLVEERDEHGVLINPFIAELNRIFTTENEDASFGQFQPADLGNYVRAIENRIQSLASRTRTPPHYLLGQSGQFPSGESLRAAETGLVAKVNRRKTALDGSHEKSMSLSFKVMGDPRWREYNVETIWKDSESRSDAQLSDSLVKLMSIGVPQQALWERYGFSPPEIERFRIYKMDEAIQGILNGTGPFSPSQNVPSATTETSNGQPSAIAESV
jgi:hypothetical protein